MREAAVAKPVEKTEAAEIARRLFGIEASAHSLPGEYDDNFHLRAMNGGEFVLKVMHPDREREFVEMQCVVLQYLAKNAPGLPLPRVVPSTDEKSFAETKLPDGSRR